MTVQTGQRDAYFSAAQEDRCATRHTVRMNASLRASGSHGFPVMVRDISIAGFSCEAVSGMSVGTMCWLSLPGLSGFQAEVIWNTGHMVGCAFDKLLNQAVLDDVVARHG